MDAELQRGFVSGLARDAPAIPIFIADNSGGNCACRQRQSRPGAATVRSDRTLPVLSVVAGSNSSTWPRSSNAATSALSVRQSLPTSATRLVVVNCGGTSRSSRIDVVVCQPRVFTFSVWHKAFRSRMPLRRVRARAPHGRASLPARALVRRVRAPGPRRTGQRRIRVRLLPQAPAWRRLWACLSRGRPQPSQGSPLRLRLPAS